MTPQEIFDKAYIGVMKQGVASVKPSAIFNNFTCCAYRGLNGKTACGVGHLIDDETAREWDMIGSIIDVIYTLEEDDLPPWVVPNKNLLEDIQMSHDDAHHCGSDTDPFLTRFHSNMKEAAEKHSLIIPKFE